MPFQFANHLLDRFGFVQQAPELFEVGLARVPGLRAAQSRNCPATAFLINP